MSFGAIELGKQSRQLIDKPVPEDLEPPIRVHLIRNVSKNPPTNSEPVLQRRPTIDSIDSDAAIAKWVADRIRMRSRSSVASRCTGEDFNISSRSANRSSRKSSKGFGKTPRPAFVSLVMDAGVKLKNSMYARFHRETGVETFNSQIAGARLQTSMRAQCVDEASKQAQYGTEASMATSVPTFCRPSQTPVKAPIVPIDDTTGVPADVAMSLLKAANDRRKDGQHKIVINPMPHLVQHGCEQERCMSWL